jgi:hypothetical protein
MIDRIQRQRSVKVWRRKSVDDEDITFCLFDVVLVNDVSLFVRWFACFENVHLLSAMCVVFV